MSSRRFSRIGAALLGAGGVVVAAFTRTPWITASYFDDRAGGGVSTLRGSDWSAESAAVSILLIVAAIATLVLRRVGRRVVGAIAAIAALGAAISPVRLLVDGADKQRVLAILSAGYEDTQANSDAIAGWSQITDAVVHPAWVALSIVGFLLAAGGGALVASRPGEDSATLNKYETDAVRRSRLNSDLESTPDSGRVMWDALDVDIDPTDTSPPRG
ncbi:Tryptophan-associated transmembrane protein [Corynebacterium capitovis DSM 44611]|uniref:TIGR02234 family membrane protein n=1 Tax=Corynebacterium capitovis TaxID=131081 RepID=UPI00036F791A|nr:TIGR02234 family membrane protein [Corynebacterium capitovis]WKD57412.1 Tryptophan-associated transmembrane protein [Corynebacterium capitovis DSM 44611]